MTALDTPTGFRTKPHNLEAEQCLLGAILINNEAFHQVAFLQDSHFYEPVHGRIYAAMSRVIIDGRIADPVTLKLEFDQDETLKGLNGAQYLGNLARVAETILNAGDYARHLHDLAVKRALIEASEEVANLAYDATDDRPGVVQLELAQGLLDRIALDQPQESWRSVSRLLDDIAESMGEPAETFTTGLPALDRSMNGGIQPGLVYGFEARPKSGKTLMLGSIALSLMRQNCPFLFLALEMGSDRIAQRMIASETRCNAIRFRKRENRDDLIGKVREFGARYGAQRAWFADEPGLTFDRLKRIANTAVVKLGIKALILDYHQLVTGCPRGQSKADFLTDIAQWLASFCGQNNCAGLIASQENRSGESFGSDGLAKACDWLAVLHKVEMDDRAVGRQEAVWADVKFNRDGDDGPLGSEENPAFRIDKIGPAMREYDDWSRK